MNRYPLEAIRNQEIAWRTPAVCPVAVSNKLKAIRELRKPELARQLQDNPRLAEMLWFLQDMSHQPGGLSKFVQAFITEFPERLRTAEMANIPWPRSGRYTPDECVRIWRSLPKDYRRYMNYDRDLGASVQEWDAKRRERFEAAMRRGIDAEDEDNLLDAMADAALNRNVRPDRSLPSLPAQPSDPLELPEIALLLQGEYSELRKVDPRKDKSAAALIEMLTPEFFWLKFANEALQELPEVLARLSDNRTAGFSISASGCWYFDDVVSALLEMMDRHAEKARGTIAKTTVSEMVLDRFEFAVVMGANVLLAGDARLGKTVAAETVSRMHPGLCRLVTVPSEPGERDFLEAHAKALHWSYDSKTTTSELKAAVKHIIAHSRLFICYDEFHFAIPAQPKRSRTPPRLDWIRTNVVDRKLGVLFCTTRQAYGRALSEFVKETKWAIEQWAGRLHDTRVFGADADDAAAAPVLNPADILAIAAHKFPDVASAVLEEIASEAYDTNTAPHTVEAILKGACWLARKAGRKTPTTADARQAIQEWKSGPPHEAFERRSGPPKIPAPSARPEPPSSRMQGPRSAAATVLPSRGKTPVLPSDPASNRLVTTHAVGTV